MTKPQIYFSIFSFGYSLAPTSSSKLICCSIPRCWIKQRQHTRVLNYREWEPAWPRPSYYPDLRPWTKYLASWNLRCLIMIPTSLSCCKNKKKQQQKNTICNLLISTVQAYHQHSISTFCFKLGLTSARAAHHMRLPHSLPLPLPDPITRSRKPLLQGPVTSMCSVFPTFGILLIKHYIDRYSYLNISHNF